MTRRGDSRDEIIEKRGPILSAWAFAFAVAGTVNLAWGYIPPSSFILKNLANKRTTMKGVRLRTTVTALENNQPTDAQFRQYTHFDAQTRVLRSRAYDLAGRELYSIERKLPDLTTAGVKTSTETGAALSALLMDPEQDSLAANLKAAGLPIRTDTELLEMKDETARRGAEVQALARVRNLVAWVIGPGARDLSAPQLWVEKDGFIPLRMVIKHDEGALDFRFEAFRFQGAFAYPGVIQVSKAGKEGSVFVREDLSELMMGIDPRELKQSVNSGFTDAGNSADGAVRDLIRRYYSFMK